jgi:hypothetical protein
MSTRLRDKKARRSHIVMPVPQEEVLPATVTFVEAPTIIVEVSPEPIVTPPTPQNSPVGASHVAGSAVVCMYEWKDRNRNGENRAGRSVHLISGGYITPATDATNPDIIIGVVTVEEDSMTLNCPSEWPGRWLRDQWGHRVLGPSGEPEQNPLWKPKEAYVPRTSRPEWARVVLHGTVKLRTGQPRGVRWQYVRTLSEGIEEWLIP